MSTFNSPFPTNSARNAAFVSSVGTSMFLVILAVLHVVRPDLDPSWRFISEYELGPLGWLMHVAFICLAVGAAGVAFAVVSQARSIASYVGTALLLISAAGMALARVVAPDSKSRIHDIGAMLDLVPFAALAIAWNLSRNAMWASTRVSLWRTARRHADQYERLFDVRSVFLHGCAMSAISTEERVMARSLAREVVEALIRATEAGPVSSREDFLDGLLDKGAPLI
ncbi:DUF998 domain-containing protein [Methylosinus sp. LW4]|uniref:DUF998 domain-containing protein n=1 Tax=Methylosinus sp. LW4 TaxID=136993 RepID=UPI00037B3258|nr:DUF998 domain-containing protein [Methylosinus sp. LW4]